jgi:uncharacterized protein (DUF2141 family)
MSRWKLGEECARVGNSLWSHRCALALSSIAGLAVGASSAGAVPLEVTVANVRSDAGQVAVCVFSGPRSFPNCAAGERIATALRPAQRGAMRFDFDAPSATLAVAVIHDENGNGTLDTNFIGIPREGVGVSNNPKPRRGPPLHAEAAFTLTMSGGAISINLVYP